MEEVFGKVLSYLSEQGLSESQALRLSTAAFIPVANATRLARPSLLFSRLRVNLSPFAFEVPAAFISHAKVEPQLPSLPIFPVLFLQAISVYHRDHAEEEDAGDDDGDDEDATDGDDVDG